MKLAGIILIILGVLVLAYQGIRYTRQEKVLDLGSVEITAKEKRTIPVPPIVGGIAVVAGILLVMTDRRKAR